jgi:EAL domain-containing protein (putative c-di-GMP-specific phosphodiesterase class I)
MGSTVSIDDFGTGYSSLSHLKKFPITTLKIAQQFVNEIQSDSDEEAIVSAIIAMAKNLRSS